MTLSNFTIPIQERYFEDYPVGSVYEFGSITVEEADVIAFARQFDPQDFHTDPEAAKNSAFGGLIASGWHTGALMMRLIVDNFLSTVASVASPGVDELRWLKPVRPGDVLSARVTILETRRSNSNRDRGIVRTFAEVLNQQREVVMDLKAVNIMLCRETTAQEEST